MEQAPHAGQFIDLRYQMDLQKIQRLSRSNNVSDLQGCQWNRQISHNTNNDIQSLVLTHILFQVSYRGCKLYNYCVFHSLNIKKENISTYIPACIG